MDILNNLDKEDDMGSSGSREVFNANIKEYQMMICHDIEFAKPHVEVSKKISVGTPKKIFLEKRVREVASSKNADVIGCKEGRIRGVRHVGSNVTSRMGKRSKSVCNFDTGFNQEKQPASPTTMNCLS